jgi:hypothetical protein
MGYLQHFFRNACTYSNQKIITLVSESMDMSNNGLVSVIGWCLTQGSATFQIWRELTFLNVN